MCCSSINAIKHAVDNQGMQRLLANCCYLVGHFKHSALATDRLMRKQKALGFKKMLHVIQECQLDGIALSTCSKGVTEATNLLVFRRYNG